MKKNPGTAFIVLVGGILVCIVVALAIILVTNTTSTSPQLGAITYGRVVQLHHAEAEFTEQVTAAESELERLYNVYTLEALEEEESFEAILAFSEVELEWAEEEARKLEIQGEDEPGYERAQREYYEAPGPPVETGVQEGALPGYEGYGALS